MENENLQQIAQFVDKNAKEQLNNTSKKESLLIAKENLKKYTKRPEKKFTFTVGTMNAYLG